MNKSQSLDTPLKPAPTILQQYVRALVSENLKLLKQVAQLYAKSVSKDHQIASLKGELQKLGHKDFTEELKERIRAGRARLAQLKEHEPTP